MGLNAFEFLSLLLTWVLVQMRMGRREDFDEDGASNEGVGARHMTGSG